MKKLITSIAILLNSLSGNASYKDLTVSAIEEDSIYVRMVYQYDGSACGTPSFDMTKAERMEQVGLGKGDVNFAGYRLEGLLLILENVCLYDTLNIPAPIVSVNVKSRFMKLNVESGKDFSLQIPANVDYVDFTYDPKTYENSERLCAYFVRSEDMLNKTTGECAMAGTSCEVRDLVEQGYEIAPAGTCNKN